MSSASQNLVARCSKVLTLPAWSAKRSTLEHGFWAIGDQVVVSLASFLSAVIVGRFCSPQEFGIYSLAVSIFWFAAGIPNALVWTPYTSRAPRLSPARRTVYAGSAMVHLAVILAAMVLLLSLSAVGRILASGSSDWFSTMCMALVPFTFFMTLREHTRRTHMAHLQLQELLWIDGPIAVAQLAILLILAEYDALSAATGLLAVAAACSLSALWWYRKRDRIRIRANRAVVHYQYNIRFGRWLVIVSLAWLLGDASYRWIVGAMLGLTALGQLAAALNIVMFVNPLLLTAKNLARALAANKFAESGPDGVRRGAIEATLVFGVGFAIFFAGLALLGGQLVTLLFGDAYAGQSQVVAAISLGMFFRALLVPVEAALVAMQRGRELVVAALVQLLLTAGSVVPLIHFFGIEGVGYALAIGGVGGLIIQWCFFLLAQSNQPTAMPDGNVQ